MRPVVSVVCPVYNGERFLQRALDSALNQTFPAGEVIVVDDGSSDGTPDILAGYGSRIRTLRIPHSGGCSAPRNAGIRASSGRFIAFLDADDSWSSNKLAEQVAAASGFPGARFICSDFITHYRSGEPPVRHLGYERYRDELASGKIVFGRPFDAMAALILRNFVGCPSCVMVARSLIRDAGYFNPEFRCCEDIEYWLRCARFTPFLIVGKPLVYKRTHDANMVNDKVRVLLYRKRVLGQFKDREMEFIYRNRLSAPLREAFFRVNLALAKTIRGSFAEKAALYAEAFLADPSPGTLVSLVKGMVKRE